MKKIIIGILLIALSIGLIGCGQKQSKSEETKEKLTFDTLKVMPEFKCKDNNDKDITNDIFNDKKLTMINLWGTFCGPCIDEMPELQEIYEEMKDKGVNVVGVVGDGRDNEIEALDLIRKTGVKYTNIIPNEKFEDDFVKRTDSVPVTIFVNSKGERVGDVIVGSRPKAEYVKIIDKLLKDMK